MIVNNHIIINLKNQQKLISFYLISQQEKNYNDQINHIHLNENDKNV